MGKMQTTTKWNGHRIFSICLPSNHLIMD